MITVNIIFEGPLLIFFSIMMKNGFFLKNIAIVRLEYKNHTLYLWPKSAKIDTVFMTKTAEKPYLLGPHTPLQPVFGSTPRTIDKIYAFHIILVWQKRPLYLLGTVLK